MEGETKDYYFKGKIYTKCSRLSAGHPINYDNPTYEVAGSHSFKDGEDVTGRYELKQENEGDHGGNWITVATRKGI